jgi:hypothetical protein
VNDNTPRRDESSGSLDVVIVKNGEQIERRMSVSLPVLSDSAATMCRV